MSDDYVSAAEAARLLGVSRQRVGELVRQGKLPAVRPWPHAVLIERRAVAERLSKPGWPTVEEVAKQFKRPIDQVYAWHRGGYLHNTIRREGRLYFDPAELARFKPPPSVRKRASGKASLARWAVARSICESEGVESVALIEPDRLGLLTRAYICDARPEWTPEQRGEWERQMTDRLLAYS